MNGMFGLLIAAKAQQAAAEARLEASRGALKATEAHRQPDHQVPPVRQEQQQALHAGLLQGERPDVGP